MSKKLFVYTMGCAMNVLDSEHMIADLKRHEGYEQTTDLKDADLILINTCSVREKPTQKLFSELGAFNRKRKSGSKIGVCGCTASHLGHDIIMRAPYVDFVLGARNVSKITQVLHEKGAVESSTSFDETSYDFHDYSTGIRSSINVSVGCNKACTYCIVPHTRGKEISISPHIILEQVKRSISKGAKEIMLLGQNVNSYGKDLKKRVDFSDLLNMVSDIDGVERIRFTSPHPLDMSDKFMMVFSSNPKVAKHMHMPLQSGSTRILKNMQRGYSKDSFLRKAQRLRELDTNITIGTDIIVGFPGETQDDFLDTIDVVERVGFEQIFSFVFSPRPLTKAASMTDLINKELAKERLNQLQTLYKNNLAQKKLSQVSKTLSMLVETHKDGNIYGKAQNHYSLLSTGGKELVGKLIDVEIVAIEDGFLQGKRLVS